MKLPRLQLHLSTCIVLMFVAGGVIWANIAPHLREQNGNSSISQFGWPFVISNRLEYDFDDYGHRVSNSDGIIYKMKDGREFYLRSPVSSEWLPGGTVRAYSEVDRKNVALNIITAILILAAVAFACEWLIRRRRSI
jgi:hypothetical protein